MNWKDKCRVLSDKISDLLGDYMIKITDIRGGWLELHIKERVFSASYLTSVAEDLDNLIMNIQKPLVDDFYTETIYFDGEGSELYLTFRKDRNDCLTIIWEEYSYPKLTLDCYECDTDEFIREVLSELERTKEEYDKEFTLK